jgi:hypothetical protein
VDIFQKVKWGIKIDVIIVAAIIIVVGFLELYITQRYLNNVPHRQVL